MSEEAYQNLSRVLNILPNGFPSTESGVEIKLLKKIFTPDEADLFCDLRLKYETAEQIAERTGRPLEGLEAKLITMKDKGQISGVNMGVWIFRMMPWILGIYEDQLNHLDEEFAQLNEEYYRYFGKQFFSKTPQLMQTLPIEEEIPMDQVALSYERVSNIIENSQSFLVQDCVCKKEQGLLDNPCEKPLEICMGFAPMSGFFDNYPSGRAISKEEAKEILNKAEEAGLVHLTHNLQGGHYFICNCCGCCCAVLKGINKLGMPATTVVNSHYYAVINPEECTVCGTCADERCQVNAIEEGENAYEIKPDRCIGCGLCISTCPGEAIRLVRRNEEEIVSPPIDQVNWFKERGQQRGIDFSKYE